MVEGHIVYEGDLHCQATHAPSRSSILTDAPVDNQGRGEAFSPTDLVATALGTCMITIMAMAARKDSIRLGGTRVRVEKHMSTDPPRRIAKLVVEFTLAPGIPPERRHVLERAAHTCPVFKSLHPDIEVQLSFTYPD